MSKNFHNKFIGVFFSVFFIASPVLSKTVITWWGEGSAVRDPDVIDIIENRFNAQHDDIELDIVFKEEVSETTRTALLSGTGPDIFESPGPSYIKMFQDAGFVKSLDQYDKSMDGKISYCHGLIILVFLMVSSMLSQKIMKV